MNSRKIGTLALCAAAAFGLLCNFGMHAAWAASTTPSQPCIDATKTGKIDSAKKVGGSGDASTVSLGDKISIRVMGLGADFQKACTATPLVLYLNSYPIRALTGTVTPAPAAADGSSVNDLNFVLRVVDGSQASWVPILGRPSTTARDIFVSVGLEEQYPLPTTGDPPHFKLDILGNGWFFAWLGLFLFTLIVFLVCAILTNVIRDGNPIDATDPTHPERRARGTFSLSKSQGAWWFFIILASYLLIGLVTGDWFNSINSTALILLGIGAGTVIGSTIVDHATQPEDAALTEAEITAAKEKLKNKQITRSQYRQLTKQSDWYLPDILSDANGVSFHRFQMATFTLVLGIVFAKGVFENLAMPEFNSTLMGLLGLSAGTYLGLKIPEAGARKT